MAMKLKQGVTVSKDGNINIGAGVKGVDDVTKTAVATRNTNIAGGNAYANTVIGKSMSAQTGGTSSGTAPRPGSKEAVYQNSLNAAAQGSAASIPGQPVSTGIPSDTNLESTIVSHDIAPVPGSADSIIESDSEYEKAEKEAYNKSQEPIDESEIRKRIEADFQKQIDATNTLYSDKLNQARIQGQGRSGSSTAMQARGGLLGSDFGAAQTSNVQAYNNQQEDAVQMEKQTKLNEINSVVQQLASSEIADRKLAKASGSTNWLAFLKAAPARKTEKTNKLAQVILMKDLKTKDVSDDALQTAGISRQDLELAYYQAKQAQNKGIAEDARVAATDAQTAKEREFQNTINQAQVDKIAYDKEHPQVATSIIQGSNGDTILINTQTGEEIKNYGRKADVKNGTPTDSSKAPAPSREPTISSEFTQDGTFKVNIANGATPRKSSRGYYECGMLVNDTLGTSMGDAFNDKMRYNNSSTPVVGGAFIQEYGETGHTGVIESINADGTLNILETNYPLGSGVSRKTINPNSRGITGYYNPKTAGSTGGISSQAQAVIDQINSQGGKPQDYILGTSADSQALLNEVLRGLNTQGGKGNVASESSRQNLDLASKTIEELKSLKDFSGTASLGNSGLGFLKYGTLGATKDTEFLNKVDKLKGILLSLDGPAVKAIFGPQISNTDIEAMNRIIAQGLDPMRQKPEAFLSSLNDLVNKITIYKNKLATGEATTGGSTPVSTGGQTVGGGGVTNGAI